MAEGTHGQASEINYTVTLPDEAARKLKVSPGTKVSYIPYSEQELKRIYGDNYNPRVIHMKNVYDESGNYLGGNINFEEKKQD
jgi:hypothetical protein